MAETGLDPMKNPWTQSALESEEPSSSMANAPDSKNRAVNLSGDKHQTNTNVVQDYGSETNIDLSDHDNGIVTTRREIWAWYAYYIGNSGLSLFNFAPSQFQNLLSQRAYDSAYPPFTMACTDSTTFCVLPFLGSHRSVSSSVLVTNGISFALQSVIILLLGSFADYGRWRPYILMAVTFVAWGVGFGWMGAYKPERYLIGTGLYIVGLIAYQTSLTFWTAAFPGLARDLAFIRQSKKALSLGEIDETEYFARDSHERNRLSNMSFYVCSAGELIILGVIVGVLFAVKVNDSVANNNFGFSVLIATATAFWVVLAIPWFILEQHRPGEQIPHNKSYLSVGFYNLASVITQIWTLKQTMWYLIGYFLLSDALNTTVTVIATLQNEIVSYSTLELTYLLIVGIFTQAVGIYAFWQAQKYYKIATKSMLLFVAFWIIMLNAWGCFGITLTNFGFKKVYEVWLYQALYGLLVCPYYAYSQTMISEVIPPGKEFLFFAVFSIVGKTSSFIGPFVSSAIIDRSGNNNMPFTFLLGLSIFSTAIIWIVDVKKSKQEAKIYLAKTS